MFINDAYAEVEIALVGRVIIPALSLINSLEINGIVLHALMFNLEEATYLTERLLFQIHPLLKH